MKDYQKILVITIIASIAISATVMPINAQESNDKSENYKQLLGRVDDAIRAVRFNNDPSGALSDAESLYEDELISGVDLANEGLGDLDGQIKSSFSSFDNQGDGVTVSEIRELRGNIEEVANELGVGLPFHFKHSLFIIIGLSFLLALGVTLVNRFLVDWEKVNKSKARMKEWQNKLKEAQRQGKKKEVRKLKKQQGDVMGEQKTVMMSMFKPMIFYIIPYFFFWWWMNGVFGGWVIAWLPFNLPWPNLGLRIFSGTVASLGFLGWYLLCYFGFAQVWRRFLIPSD
ncbi:MAG: TMCO1/EMC3 family protein [Hadesarchaea archaeon]|nr:TMCO1/EMC3 family protein [Hadesarchaea archaeon]